MCSEPEAMDQPQASTHAQAGDGKEYTQIPSPESVNKPQELAVPSQNKGELEEMKKLDILVSNNPSHVFYPL